MHSNVTPEGSPVDPATGATPVDAAALVAPAKKSKVRRNVLLASGAVGLVGIGSTLAANINLNSGNNVEFGQGVARTTACDQDGFTINPVTSYDNTHSIFRLDYVEITGLDLTPVGTGFSDAGYGTQADAKAAHPGEYYNNGWKRTCDGVVLDFKAYTDDTSFWNQTRDGYTSNSTNDISSPIAWYQYNGNPNLNGDVGNFGFAVIFDTTDDNQSEDANWAVGYDGDGGSGYVMDTTFSYLDHTTAANSTFRFGSLNNATYRPNAASISKITVSSMSIFPTNYNQYDPTGVGHR